MLDKLVSKLPFKGAELPLWKEFGVRSGQILVIKTQEGPTYEVTTNRQFSKLKGQILARRTVSGISIKNIETIQ